jgi:RecB family exonuclease
MPSPLNAARFDAPLVHAAQGRWVVARKRGNLYVAPVPPEQRERYGDFIMGDLHTVAGIVLGFSTREAALTAANDLYPYAAFYRAA